MLLDMTVCNIKPPCANKVKCAILLFKHEDSLFLTIVLAMFNSSSNVNLMGREYSGA